MTIRPVSTASSQQFATQQLLANQLRMNNLQNQVSTGLRLTKPSDDPSGMVVSLSAQSSLTRLNQYASNISDGLGNLGQATASLDSVSGQLSQVRSVLLQVVNGTPTLGALHAAAAEVSSIRANVLDAMNVSYAGRPVFGGDGTPAQAFASNGTYTGNPTAPTRTAGPGTSVQVGMTGTAAFGSGATGVLGALDSIISHLTSGTLTDVQTLRTTDLSTLDGADDLISNAAASTGAWYNQLTSLQTQNQGVSLALTSRLSSVQNVDMAQALTDLKTAETSYQAALYATAQTNRQTLVSFLS